MTGFARMFARVVVAFFLVGFSAQQGFAASLTGIRGAFLDFTKDPFYTVNEKDAVRYLPDGLLVMEEGKIKAFGPYASLKSKYPNLSVTTYNDRLILPGFIDCHIHYPQTKIIAEFGEQVLEWLQKYVFKEELNFKDKDYAHQVAQVFLQDLFRNGTTFPQVFTTTFPGSVDAIFEEAAKYNMRIIAGLTGIDRKGQAPAAYLDTAQSFYDNSKKLLEKWHGKGRALYAVTPRFALGSTEQQLELGGKLRKESKDIYVNTHLDENLEDIAKVKKLFPGRKDYLDVYEHAGLGGAGFTGGHSVHLTDDEIQRMSKTGATAAFCPSSNLFLGSGLFKIGRAKSKETPIRVCLGTDMGGGNYFSMFKVMNDAYKVGMLQGVKLSSFKALYLATLGGANGLYIDDKVGNFNPGKEADFIVVDWMAIPELAYRNGSPKASSVSDLEDKAFGLMMLGDDRVIDKTYVDGKVVYDKTRNYK